MTLAAMAQSNVFDLPGDMVSRHSSQSSINSRTDEGLPIQGQLLRPGAILPSQLKVSISKNRLLAGRNWHENGVENGSLKNILIKIP